MRLVHVFIQGFKWRSTVSQLRVQKIKVGFSILPQVPVSPVSVYAQIHNLVLRNGLVYVVVVFFLYTSQREPRNRAFEYYLNGRTVIYFQPSWLR